MSKRLRTAIVWLVYAAVVLIAVLNLFVVFAARQPASLAEAFGLASDALVPLVFVVVGGAVVALRAGNVIGWLLLVPALSTFPNTLLNAELARYTVPPSPPPAALLIGIWFQNVSWVLFIFPLFLILLLFPNGKPLTPRWRWVVAFTIAVPVLFMVSDAFVQEITLDPSPAGTSWTFANPIGLVPLSALGLFYDLPLPVCLGAVLILSVTSMLLRYRRAAAVEKAQMKWLLLTCGFFVVAYMPALVTHGEAQGLLADILNVGLFLAVISFPIAIGIAILRYRLWDIDILIRRTLTYAIVTALLLVVFFGSVILLQQIFAGVTGSGQNELVTVLSTLAIAALFVPLRNRIQNVIDRRFNRRKYDAQQILNEFGNTVRDETDLERLTGQLMQVVDESMHPRNVSVWLRGKPRA